MEVVGIAQLLCEFLMPLDRLIHKLTIPSRSITITSKMYI